MNEDILNSPLDASYKFTKVTFNVFLCHSRQKVITIISHFNIYIVGYLILRKASFLYPWLREICHFVECIISYSFPVLTYRYKRPGAREHDDSRWYSAVSSCCSREWLRTNLTLPQRNSVEIQVSPLQYIEKDRLYLNFCVIKLSLFKVVPLLNFNS